MVLKVLYTKRNVEALRRFMRQIIRESKQIEAYEAKFIYRRVRGNYAAECPDRPKRTFQNVFIPDALQERIETAVKSFCANEQWYHDHCIPYHYGILLHGNPGTGKSSVVQAITNLIDCDIFYISAESLSEAVVNEEWIRYASKDRMRVVIVEDIDTTRFTLDRSNEKDGKAFRTNTPIATIGTFLNMIDGFANHEKVIYIFTTNHLEKLDPALVRPGRVDLCLEIDYINDETFAKFCRFHYNENPASDIHVREGLTFAELQVKVMEGCTLEQLCEYVKKEES
jgi:chaperone BCS1